MQPRDPKQSSNAPVALRLEQELVSMNPVGRHFIKVTGDLALGFTDRRHSEKGNQDRLLVAWNSCAALKKERWFFAGICDGVGGESDGDIAASIALAEAVAALCIKGNAINPVQGIKLAALAAHKAVLRRLQGRSATTFSGFLLNAEGNAAFGWVGDSRIYQLQQNLARQLSYDDTLEEMLRRKSSLLPAESGFDPAWADLQPRWKESLGQAIGSDLPIEPHAEPWPNKDLSDGCILCTDGVWKPLEGIFDKVISSGIKQQDVTRRLLSTSENLGGTDNATAIVLPSVGAICEWLNSEPYANADLVEVVFPNKTLIAPTSLFVSSTKPELKTRFSEKSSPEVEQEKPTQQRKRKKKSPQKPTEPLHGNVQFSIVESSEDDTTKSVSQVSKNK